MSDAKKPNNKKATSPQAGLILGIVFLGFSKLINNKTFNEIDSDISIAIGVLILALLLISRIRKRRLEAKLSQERKFSD